MEKEKNSLRGSVTEYIKKKYGSSPEHLWMRWPDYAVFRHSDNRKWFAIIMDITGDKLGRSDREAVDVINVKTGDPLLGDLLIKREGYYRGWHMAKGDWVTILLDGAVPEAEIERLIDRSFLATATAEGKLKERPPKDWIVPANPKYYDIVHAFDSGDEIIWKQGSGVKKGDTVFIYAGAPVSAILYKCAVTETDIPFDHSGGALTIKKVMRIKLKKRYPQERFTFKALGSEYGIYAVRGPRGIPAKLKRDLE
ncbi:MAG: MmcQ/YjbR family DNA-binding protein [Clostridiales bacterium]|nr:MmcQ/YjbR family DNA-binding protein [Clostridiales bacterium]